MTTPLAQLGALNREQQMNTSAREFSELARVLAVNGFDPLKAFKEVRDSRRFKKRG